MTKKRIHTYYRWLTAVLFIAAGICLIIACIGIYRMGNKPFHAQSVAAAFRPIAIPVCLCPILAIGGFILDLLCPENPAKATVPKQYDVILAKLQSKLNPETIDPALANAMSRLQSGRKLHSIISFCLLAICSIVFLCYGLNPKNFPENQATESIVRSMWWFIPCLIIPFGYSVFAAYYRRSSICKEIELAKQAATSGAVPKAPAKPIQKSRKFLPYLSYSIVAVALILIIIGAWGNGMEEVFGKAVNLCKECVGIG